jgi:hypothetical protein
MLHHLLATALGFFTSPAFVLALLLGVYLYCLVRYPETRSRSWSAVRWLGRAAVPAALFSFWMVVVSIGAFAFAI